jgi:hypothetical protein
LEWYQKRQFTQGDPPFFWYQLIDKKHLWMCNKFEGGSSIYVLRKKAALYKKLEFKAVEFSKSVSP